MFYLVHAILDASQKQTQAIDKQTETLVKVEKATSSLLKVAEKHMEQKKQCGH